MISSLARRAATSLAAVEKVRILGRNFATQITTIDNSNDVVKGCGGGMGYGNVQKQHIPSVESENLYRLVTSSPKTVSIIGAPMTYGQPFVGADSSPALIRGHGLVRDLDKLGWRVDDTGDIDFVTIFEQQQYQQSSSVQINAKNCQKIGAGTKFLSNIVESKMKLGHFPLILGGDHSIAVGSLAGILRAKPDTGVIWVDAHADLNTPASSVSGNMHGMPLAIMMKELVPDRRAIPGFEWLEEKDKNGGGLTSVPFLSPKSLVYVGLRDIDKAERQFIRQLGIKIFTMYDIDHLGIGRVMDLALEHLLTNNPYRPIHLSYDIDAVDPIHAPATGTAVRGGLTWREAHFVAEHVVKSGNLASAEIVEVNATLSDGQGASVTVELGHQLVNALLGEAML